MHSVYEVEIAIDFWNKFKILYISKTFMIRLYLKRQLYNFHISKGKFFKKYMNIINKLIYCSIKVSFQ